MVVLPHGLYYGRLDPVSAISVAGSHLAGELDLDHLRGRSSHPDAVQAAEILLRRELGETREDAVVLVDRSTDADVTTATFAVAGATYDVGVRTTRDPATADPADLQGPPGQPGAGARAGRRSADGPDPASTPEPPSQVPVEHGVALDLLADPVHDDDLCRGRAVRAGRDPLPATATFGSRVSRSPVDLEVLLRAACRRRGSSSRASRARPGRRSRRTPSGCRAPSAPSCRAGASSAPSSGAAR